MRCSQADISSITFVASCRLKSDKFNNDQEVSCTEPARPGTFARINCQRGYKSVSADVEQVVSCRQDGRWFPPPQPCVQICGQEGPDGAPYIVGGEVTNITKVPWHVGIYKKSSTNGELVQQCGGTILNPKVIISAAHCFWNKVDNKLEDPSEFRVSAGKAFRSYDDVRETNKFQILAVDRIHVVDGYDDYEGLYANDLAVVVLSTYIEYKVHIAPICIDYRYELEEKTIPAGFIGRVAGWGLESSGGQPSNLLKSIELPVVQRDVCKSNFGVSFRPFVTGDKFCAGLLNLDVGLCQGDSGGGLVFAKVIDGRTIFYLRGIVSTGPNKSGSCDSNQYTTFTNVAHFADFIFHHEFNNRPTQLPAYIAVTSSDANRPASIAPAPFLLSNSTVQYSRVIDANPPAFVASVPVQLSSPTVQSSRVTNSESRYPYASRAVSTTFAPMPPSVSNCGTLPYPYSKPVSNFEDNTVTNPEFVPWHVNINKYNMPLCNKPVCESIKNLGKLGIEHICDGTIVSPRIVLTAMSCLWNEQANAPWQLVSLEVQTSFSLQFRNVERIDYEAAFATATNNKSRLADIGVIVVDRPFEFNFFVSPICLQLDVDDNDALKAGTVGSLFAWNKPEFILQSKATCVLEQESRDYVTADKLCAVSAAIGAKDNCTKLLGNGLVTSKYIMGGDRYTLRGIASFEPASNYPCNGRKYALFTNIAYYDGLIRKNLNRYQLRPSIKLF